MSTSASSYTHQQRVENVVELDRHPHVCTRSTAGRSTSPDTRHYHQYSLQKNTIKNIRNEHSDHSEVLTKVTDSVLS